MLNAYTAEFFITHGVLHPPWYLTSLKTVCFVCNCRSLLSYLFKDIRTYHSSKGVFQILIIRHYQSNREPDLYRTCHREDRGHAKKQESVFEGSEEPNQEESVMAGIKLDGRNKGHREIQLTLRLSKSRQNTPCPNQAVTSL